MDIDEKRCIKLSRKQTYQNIDMKRTGRKLKAMLEAAGYTPRMIQEFLHLSCVQPIYRWYKGLILPSVDHLYMLSELLGVHMEEFLVKKNLISMTYDVEKCCLQDTQKRFAAYYKQIYRLVA